MAVRRIKHLSKGYAALLVDPKVQADLKRRAQRIADAAGGDVVAESSTPRRRARASVIAPNGDPGNRILRNLDSGR